MYATKIQTIQVHNQLLLVNNITGYIAYFFFALTTFSFLAFPFSFRSLASDGESAAHATGSIYVPSSSNNLLRFLVIGLGVQTTTVIVLVGVAAAGDASSSTEVPSSSNNLLRLLVKGLGVETAAVITLVGVEIVVVDGTTVTFFLPLFLLGFGGAGGGASES